MRHANPRSCLLYQIIETIIERLYERRRFTEYRETGMLPGFVQETSARLIDWRAHVAPAVLLDTAYLPSRAPPPHILTLK